LITNAPEMAPPSDAACVPGPAALTVPPRVTSPLTAPVVRKPTLLVPEMVSEPSWLIEPVMSVSTENP